MVRNFAMDGQVGLLSGTPVSLPTDAYAYISLITPGVYKSQYQFESIHVESRDFWGRPEEFSNLDMLSRNLLLQAARVLKEDVLKDLPELTYTPIYYDLDPKHLKLYQQLAEEQMAKLENGDKIDLTSASALFQALQQIPCSAEHFSEGKVKSTVLDLIDTVMEELSGKKLVIFCHYRMTTKRLLEHLAPYNAVALFGGTAAADRQKNIDRFIQDPDCKVIILQHKSGGAGIDGLQDVCSEVLMVELPYRASDLRQAIARVHRDGQKTAVNCRIAIAQQTLQVKLWEYVQDNDSLINTVIRGPKGIREAINGR
jgi:SNF2 family DNA or RNA helicase